MSKAGMKTKNDYQQCIAIYVKRRTEYKAKFGVESDTYKKYALKINKKLSVWRRAIKRIEIKENKIKQLDAFINSYLGVSVKNSIHISDEKTILAKNIFIKYGMEHNIEGTKLCEYMGGRGKWTASRRRINFTKSFKYNPQNRDSWHRFKNFVKNNPINS